MKLYECKNPNYWMVRVKDFPKEKRKEIERIADRNRVSIGAYIGNLLDEQIKQNKEARA